MKLTSKLITATATAMLLASGAAYAKGHNQADTAVPGADAGSETAAAAQTLGSAKGKRPAERTPMSPGKSGDAASK